MNRRRLGLVLAGGIVLVAIITVIYAVVSQKPKPVPRIIPSPTPTPGIHSVEDLYRAERQLKAIDLEKGQSVVNKNNDEVKGTAGK